MKEAVSETEMAKKWGVGVILALALSLQAAEPFNVLVPVDWTGEPHETQVFKVAKRRMVAVKPAGRVAFERGEEGAGLKLCVVGTDDVFTVPVETRLKPGEYDMPVPISGRLPSGEEVVATNSITFRIGPTFAGRMPVVMWSGGPVNPSDAREFGFTHLYRNDSVTSTKDVSKQTQRLVSLYDDALVASMRLMHGLKVQYPAGEEKRKRFYRCLRDGRQPSSPRDVNQPEVSNPELLEHARRLVAMENEAVGYHPGFAGVLPCSERRDHSYPSFNTEHLRYKAATGRDVPPEVKKKVLEYPIARQRFPDGVVPEDDPLYAYYRWFWGGGDGWLDYLGGIADEYRKLAGRYGDGSAIQRKRPFFSFWDPSVRCPPKWGSGGDVDVISQWVYAQPEPMNVAGPAEEVIAMAAGRAGQQPMIMTQLICYRAQLAPTNVTVSPLPEWVKRRSRASFPTIPADSLQEAVWSMLAKPVKGIMFHGWRTIFETGAETGYTFTSPETAARMKELLHGLVAPLGPMLKDLERAEPEVAVLESFTTTAFGGPGSWGWFSSPIMFLQRARLDPRVIYEETVMRDGFGKTKILYAPQCEFLSAPVVEKVKAFQKAGGILMADEKLLPALKADVVVPVFSYRKPPKSDHAGDVNAITKTREETVRKKREMSESAEALRKALSERYGYAPKVDSSSPEIVTYSRAWRDTPYVFAVNDRRTFGDYVGQWGLTMERGVPFSGSVMLNDPDGKVGAVYELSRGGEVPFRKLANGYVEVPLSYETNDGRLLLFLTRRIASVDVAVGGPQTAVVEGGRSSLAPGDEISVTMTVRDENGEPIPARLPVEIHIYDSAGCELDGAGYACAEGGICTLAVRTNLNDAPGGYRVVCRDRASGLVASCRTE